jgi:hypothetical protein
MFSDDPKVRNEEDKDEEAGTNEEDDDEDQRDIKQKGKNLIDLGDNGKPIPKFPIKTPNTFQFHPKTHFFRKQNLCVLEWQDGGVEWSDNWMDTDRQQKSLVKVDSWEGDSWSNEEWGSPTAKTIDGKQEKEKGKEDKTERRERTGLSGKGVKDVRSEGKVERKKKVTSMSSLWIEFGISSLDDALSAFSILLFIYFYLFSYLINYLIIYL